MKKESLFALIFVMVLVVMVFTIIHMVETNATTILDAFNAGDIAPVEKSVLENDVDALETLVSIGVESVPEEPQSATGRDVEPALNAIVGYISELETTRVQLQETQAALAEIHAEIELLKNATLEYQKWAQRYMVEE